ncbi:MAG: redoxin domain-containing protein [bacterium JZ-2024 1]
MLKVIRKIPILIGVSASMTAISGFSGGVAVGQKAPEFPAHMVWLNSNPIRMRDLRGKIVIVDFWEYTCVNCLRTLPYMKKWHAKYADKGLVIIGVHTPEFTISKKSENVKAFATREGITYPIVLDSENRVWKSYQGFGGYWPRKYLIDARGIVRYDIIGEGNYEKTEQRIQELLRETNSKLKIGGFVGYAREEDEPGVVCFPRTAETYAGYLRGRFANVVEHNRDKAYRASPMAREGEIALDGWFRVESERVIHSEFTEHYTDSIQLRWKGSEINAVMEPGDSGLTEVRVLINGKPVEKEMRGRDIVETNGGHTIVGVDFPRMYQLVGGKKWGEYALQMYVKDKAFALYAFTFGSCAKPDSSK